MTEIRDDKPLMGMGEVLRLSWPAGLSMLNSTVMRFLDGLLVSFLGIVPFSAQFVAGMASFVPESFATGLLIVVNTYVAQNLGAKLLHRCGQYAWAGFLLALCFCLVICPLIFFAEPIFHTFNSTQIETQQAEIAKNIAAAGTSADPQQRAQFERKANEAVALLRGTYELKAQEIMYFRYMILAVFLTLTARPLEQFFYGVHRPRTVLAASITANVVNLVLAYILVFGGSGLIAIDRILHLDLQHSALGRLNLPKFGLEGAAWANLTSWGLYMGILLTVFLSRRISATYITRQLHVRFGEIVDLVRIGWPAGVQFLCDVLPWTVMLTWLIGRFGEADLAATTAAMRWMPISFMPAVGIGTATTALVGKYMGQRQPHIARRRAHAALLLGLIYMGFCGIVFLVFRHDLVRIFVTMDPEMPAGLAAGTTNHIIELGGYVMICAAVFQLFDAVGIVFLGGLRGAGDTFWPMLFTVALSWGITVGGGYLMVRCVPQLGSMGPWLSASLYIIVLGLVLAWRFERGAWQKIDLLHRQPAVQPAQDTPLPPMTPPAPPSPPSSM